MSNDMIVCTEFVLRNYGIYFLIYIIIRVLMDIGKPQKQYQEHSTLFYCSWIIGITIILMVAMIYFSGIYLKFIN